MLHGTVLFQFAHHRGYRRGFLPDSDVDTFDPCTFLVDDRIDGNRCLADLTITDDQLPLPATDRYHSVNGLEANLNRLVDGLAGDDAGSNFLQSVGQLRVEGTPSIYRSTQGIDDTPLQFRADRHFQNTTCATTRLTFGNTFVVAEYHRTYRIPLKVQGHAVKTAAEVDHFSIHDLVQAMDADNAVAD